MNFSVLFLSTSLYLSSPFLSVPQSMPAFNLNVNHVLFKQSFSNFLYSQSILANFQFKNTHFKKFLSSPIKYETYEIEGKYFYNNSIVYRENIEITIIDSVFESCRTDSFGGGIQVITSTHNQTCMNISNCLFDKCSALIDGGAIYALIARFFIQTTCFMHCYSSANQVAILRGESRYSHLINLTTICLNGIQQDVFMNDDNSRLTMFSTCSNIIICVNVNNTQNCVSKRCAGQYIISNYMAYFKYSTYSSNAGEVILRISLKNNNSSIEYVNMINNTAFLQYKSLIVCAANTEFGHFIFINNMKPLFYITTRGSLVLIDCTFDSDEKDILDSQKLTFFIGNVSYTQCAFENKPTTYEFLDAPDNMCKNFFLSNEGGSSFTTIFWLLMVIVVIALMVYCFFHDNYFQNYHRRNNADETVPFISKSDRRHFN